MEETPQPPDLGPIHPVEYDFCSRNQTPIHSTRQQTGLDVSYRCDKTMKRIRGLLDISAGASKRTSRAVQSKGSLTWSCFANID